MKQSLEQAIEQPTPNTRPPALITQADSLLLIYADLLDDAERVRIATENRVRSLQQVKGLTGSKEEAELQAMVDVLVSVEHKAELQLKRALRKHPLGPWVKNTVGIGEKQGARLLAAIGDPTTRSGPAQLWAYCGYHVLLTDHDTTAAHAPRVGQDIPTGQATQDTQKFLAGRAPKRQRGQKANWNGTAKARAFLVAESCIKQQHSPYRSVYEEGRTKYKEAVHNFDCPQCHARVGEPLKLGHQHARALRLVAKEILKDIWVEARRVKSEA